MSIFEYDKELEEKKLRKAEFEAGREIGHEVGLAEGKNQAAFETAKRMLALQEFTPENDCSNFRTSVRRSEKVAGAGQSRTVKEIIQFTNKISMTGENK